MNDIPREFTEATIETVNNAGIRVLTKRAYLTGHMRGKLDAQPNAATEDMINVAKYELLREVRDAIDADDQKARRVVEKKIDEIIKARRRWFDQQYAEIHQAAEALLKAESETADTEPVR